MEFGCSFSRIVILVTKSTWNGPANFSAKQCFHYCSLIQTWSPGSMLRPWYWQRITRPVINLFNNPRKRKSIVINTRFKILKVLDSPWQRYKCSHMPPKYYFIWCQPMLYVWCTPQPHEYKREWFYPVQSCILAERPQSYYEVSSMSHQMCSWREDMEYVASMSC